MEYQTLKVNGKTKFVVLPIKLFEAILDRLDDESDLLSIRTANKEPLYNQDDAEEYIFMNPVKRERLERGWTQKDLANRLGVKQSTVAKWEIKGAAYRKKNQTKIARRLSVWVKKPFYNPLFERFLTDILHRCPQQQTTDNPNRSSLD